MPNFKEIGNNIVAALLTIAWANTKNGYVRQDEIKKVYEDMKERI